MKKYIIITALSALFTASAFAQGETTEPVDPVVWFQVTTHDNTAAFTNLTSNDYIQFGASERTLNVNSNATLKAIVFGSGTTDISPATVDIKAGYTLTLTELYGNNTRPATVINIGGEGNLVYSGTDLAYVAQTTKELQEYNYDVKGSFSLAEKNVTVGENVHVDFGTATLGTVGFNIAKNGYVKVVETGAGWFGGKLTIADGASFDFHGSEYEIGGTSSIGKVSKVSHLSDNAVYINGATTISADTGMITYGTKEGVGKLLLKATTLTLKTSNALKRLDGQLNTLSINATGAKLVVEAAQDFAGFDFNGKSDVTFTLDLKGAGANEASLVKVNNIYQLDSNNKILIEDFVEEKFWVGSELAKNSDNTVANIFALMDSKEVALYQHSNGYLSLVVPEPAEWAAIFGAVALAFALYRRKK